MNVVTAWAPLKPEHLGSDSYSELHDLGGVTSLFCASLIKWVVVTVPVSLGCFL